MQAFPRRFGRRGKQGPILAMAIKFLCPNGHELSADESRIGKQGKCPKCHVRFLVPEPAPEDAAEDIPAGPSSAADEQAASWESPPRDTIVFPCPKGHKLNAPRSLQGKAGQCPHCQERFLIPVVDENIAFGPAPTSSPADVLDIREIVDAPFFPPPVESPLGGAFAAPSAEADIPEGIPLADEEAETKLGGATGLAAVMHELWRRRAAAQAIEVHLAGGEVIEVQQFARHPEDASIALFAARDSSGQHAISIVPWAAVSRIVVRNGPSSPRDLFAG